MSKYPDIIVNLTKLNEECKTSYDIVNYGCELIKEKALEIGYKKPGILMNEWLKECKSSLENGQDLKNVLLNYFSID